MDFDELNYFFFDLDKTIWNWDKTVIGAEDTIDSLREAGKEVYFHTDNTRLSRREYAKKLTDFGIPAEKEDILTSGYVAANYLARRNISKTYVIGEQGLIDELNEKDIDVSQDCETVLVGFDRQFNYEKLSRAFKILNEGGELIICSTESSFRTTKQVKPHQGTYNRALDFITQPTLSGKPSSVFRKEFKKYFSYFPEKSVFIGDRFADIETGNRLGMATAAVMSGDVDRDDLKQAEDLREPDYGLSSLTRLKRNI